MDADLASRLRAISNDRGESLNATVLRVLREAVGPDARRTRLLHYATWTEEDAKEFDTVKAWLSLDFPAQTDWNAWDLGLKVKVDDNAITA